MAINDPLWPRADLWLAQESPDPQIIVVGVPSARASLTPSGAAMTPLALRERLGRFATFNGEWGVDFGGVAVRDEGNWPVSELEMDRIPESVGRLAATLPPAPLKLFLGGDNAITRPLTGSLAPDISRVGLITFDAHHDVRTLDLGPTNGSPVRGLIEEDGLPGSNVVQIGIHSFANSAPYRAYCEEQGVIIHTVTDIERRGIEDVVDEALAVLASRCDQVYVDVDIDVLDRALAPACPGSRPGGLGVRHLAEGVRRCGRHQKVAAFDFVEVDADADRDGVTLDAMAHMMLAAVAGFAER